MSSRRAAASLKFKVSRGNLRSFSSFVTSIGEILTVTRCGFGKWEYQFQVQALAHAIAKSARTPGAMNRGYALSKRAQLSPIRRSQFGGRQETLPKICPGIRRTKVPVAAAHSIALETGAGVFIGWIRPAIKNLSEDFS
jgi:hypothetical protein